MSDKPKPKWYRRIAPYAVLCIVVSAFVLMLWPKTPPPPPPPRAGFLVVHGWNHATGAEAPSTVYVDVYMYIEDNRWLVESIRLIENGTGKGIAKYYGGDQLYLHAYDRIFPEFNDLYWRIDLPVYAQESGIFETGFNYVMRPHEWAVSADISGDSDSPAPIYGGFLDLYIHINNSEPGTAYREDYDFVNGECREAALVVQVNTTQAWPIHNWDWHQGAASSTFLLHLNPDWLGFGVSHYNLPIEFLWVENLTLRFDVALVVDFAISYYLHTGMMNDEAIAYGTTILGRCVG